METVKLLKNIDEKNIPKEILERVKQIIYNLRATEASIDYLVENYGQDPGTSEYVAQVIEENCRYILEQANDMRQLGAYLNNKEKDESSE